MKLATSAVPIVFAVAVDPVGAGLVASLAMPGGNATGLSSQTGDLGGNRLELLREVVSGLTRPPGHLSCGCIRRYPDRRLLLADEVIE